MPNGLQRRNYAESVPQGMAAFDGDAPTDHIELWDKFTIVWGFHSLLMGIKMVLSFELTDDRQPLRMREHCQQAFVANRVDSMFVPLSGK